MKKIRGANLGNWLVLEKWMYEPFFEGTGVEDETWLVRKTDPEALREKMKRHRDTYITEADFEYLAAHGVNVVRIPVPYFIFGDRPPFIGCIEYLDMAFEWAGRHGIQVLIDLHTVPGSQNGYDNGGITGVCKWCKQPDEVAFAHTVLERLAQRYKDHPALFGIEVLNEPISWIVYRTAPSTGKAVDKAEAEGSGYVPMKFLKGFYTEAYRRLRAILGEDKMIVFHDGFRLNAWNRFFDESGMKNVMLDTHIYIFAMESFLPLHSPWVYQRYVNINRRMIQKVEKHIPVIVGEWCISNKYATEYAKKNGVPIRTDAETGRRFKTIADMQLQAWSQCAGFFYWNYQLWPDRKAPLDNMWKESWDLARCWQNGWLPDFKA